MRILHVISSMDPRYGGPSQAIRNAHEFLTDHSVEEEIVCLDDPDTPYLGNDPLPIHPLGKGRGPLSYHPALVPWLIVNLHRFDVVIVNGIWQWHSIATWLAIRKLKRISKKLASCSKLPASSNPQSSTATSYQLPTTQNIPRYFVMPHGMLDPWFQRAKSRRLKAIRNWFYWKLVEYRVIRDAEGLLFTCEEELKMSRLTFRSVKCSLNKKNQLS